jgi:hypothetical protein
MFRMCVYMHSRFIENHPIRILEDGPLISEVFLSQRLTRKEIIYDSTCPFGCHMKILPIFYLLVLTIP